MRKRKIAGVTVLTVLVSSSFAAIPVSANVTDYQEADTGSDKSSAECEVIYKTTYDYSEDIPKYPELKVSASGYEGIYDGRNHSITVDCGTEGAVILYSTDGKTYTTKKPEYKDVGTYVIYYKVEKEGYTSTVGSASVTIIEADIGYDVGDYSGVYDGKKHSIDLSVRTEGCKILYSTDGINFTSDKPSYKEPGTYVIYYKIMRDNYKTVTGSSTVTIRAENDIEGDKNSDSPELSVSASGYEGVYDGKSHEITVDCQTDGAVILYSTDGKTYTTKKPVFIDAGTYVTYYKVEKDGYITALGSATVRINEAGIDYNVHNYNEPYDGKEHGINLSVKTEGCKILYSEDGINFTSKKPEYKEPGTYVVYYKIIKDNYATVTGKSIVEIKKSSGIVGSNNYNGSSADAGKVQTGDESHIWGYGAMLIASIFGMLKSRKEKRKL